MCLLRLRRKRKLTWVHACGLRRRPRSDYAPPCYRCRDGLCAWFPDGRGENLRPLLSVHGTRLAGGMVRYAALKDCAGPCCSRGAVEQAVAADVVAAGTSA